MEKDNSIEVENLSRMFGDVEALRSVSFEVQESESLAFLGPNGAGKSTAVEILTGQQDRDSGDVKVLDMDPAEKGKQLRSRLGILPERENPPSFLTGDEYLDFVSDIREEQINRDYWVERLRLEGKMDELTRDLSKGERQKLLVIQAFFHEPDVVFIDEPMINLDPVIQEEVKQIFREFDGTLFLCTHNVEIAEEVCDRALFIEDGSIIEEHQNTGDLKQKFLDAYDY